MAPATWAATGQSQVAANPTPPAQHPREKTYMKRQWGVEVLYVRQTAAGYMLEFRYKVLDADKSKALFERQTKPVLTHDKTGAKFIVPTPAKTGALRNSNPPLVGNTYWMFFANPGKLVQPGDTVSIEIGKFQVKKLIVQ
jgi:biotin carboxyl carrier protein